MKNILMAALFLSPLAASSAEPSPAARDFKFELPPLKLSEALRLAPQAPAAPLRQAPLTLSNASPLPTPPAPVALPTPPAPGRAMILVPRNVDPRMPIKQPDPGLDPKILVPVPRSETGK